MEFVCNNMLFDISFFTDYSFPYNKNVYSAIDELKETTFDEDNIYEELKKKRTMETDRISGDHD